MTMQLISAAIVGLITAALLFRPFFETREEFYDCVRFWFTPDFISMFRGLYLEEQWAELKLLVWIGASGLMGYGTYQLFS